VQKPVIVLGLSYGAGAAAEFARHYPALVGRLIFLAPLVISLENYEPSGRWVNANLDWLRIMWGPFWGPSFYEMAYAAIYKTYLGQRIVPDRVPPELREIPNVYRESIFHLSRAVRHFDLREYDFAALGEHRVSFLLANEEQAQAFQDQLDSFEAVSAASRGSLIWLKDAEHAIPDSEPDEAANLIDALAQGSRALESGKKYQYDGQGLRNW
jgi:pimeloyl-ACP methyl ester carboxylesterase